MIFVSLILALGALAPPAPLTTDLAPPDEDLQLLAAGSNAFALELFRELAKDSGNVIFSPYGLTAAFGMTWAGTEETVHQEIARAFHIRLEPSRFHSALAGLASVLTPGDEAGHHLCLANRLWGVRGYPYEKPFLDLTERFYGAALEGVDFADERGTRHLINAWVSERTEGMIPNLIKTGALDSLTRLVLTSAIHFKGAWQIPFPPGQTREAPFQVSAEETVTVPLMTATGSFPFARTEGGDFLELPYGGRQCSMLLILPSSGQDLSTVMGHLDEATLRAWVGALRPDLVRVFLPRFKLAAQSLLHERGLPALGLKKAFEFTRDWGPLNGDREELRISHVFHDAALEVNEEGSEAAAGAGGALRAKGLPPEPAYVFRADRPFIFLIRHRETGAILFLGRLVQPL